MHGKFILHNFVASKKQKICTMENQNLLPVEVAKFASNVSQEKQNEVQTILNRVFSGVSRLKEQIEMVVIKDENDKANMQIARTIRLSVRQERLNAAEILDQKRQEVQAQMLHFQTEDKLWLKAKQVMELLTKEIEAIAQFKEDTRKRYDLEQKELKMQQRMIQVSKFSSETNRFEYENMTDESFALFLASLEKAYNEKIEAEAKAKAEAEAKAKAEAEARERMRLENERLRKEAEQKAAQLAEERKKAEAERKIAEAKAREEREKLQKEIAEQKAKQEAILKAEREAKAKIEAELKAKQEAERKAEQMRQEAERKKAEAERQKQLAPDKDKLNNLATLLDNIELPELQSDEAKRILENTKALLGKVSTYIREKTSLL